MGGGNASKIWRIEWVVKLSAIEMRPTATFWSGPLVGRIHRKTDLEKLNIIQRLLERKPQTSNSQTNATPHILRFFLLLISLLASPHFSRCSGSPVFQPFA